MTMAKNQTQFQHDIRMHVQAQIKAQALVQAQSQIIAPPIQIEFQERALKVCFINLYFGKLYLDCYQLCQYCETIFTQLGLSIIIALHLQLFFFKTVLILAGLDISASIYLGKNLMFLYSKTNSKFFFANILKIVGFL